MGTNSSQNLQALKNSITSSLEIAEKKDSQLRRIHHRLLAASLIGSALATLIAGLTAAQGPWIGQGTEGWRMACIAAAGFGFISTVSSGASQQFKISDRYTEGKECTGKLKALQVMITTGSHPWEEIAREYEDLVHQYPDMI